MSEGRRLETDGWRTRLQTCRLGKLVLSDTLVPGGAFSEHPDQHRRERLILLAVDQELVGWLAVRRGLPVRPVVR